MICSISVWNTNHAIDMGFLFSGCSSLLSIPDISKWNLINVKNINGMFSECSSLIILPDISNWFNFNRNIDYNQQITKNIKSKINLYYYLKIKILEKIYHIYFIIVHN